MCFSSSLESIASTLSYWPIVVLVVPVSLPLLNGCHFSEFPLCRESLFIDAEIDQLTQEICSPLISKIDRAWFLKWRFWFSIWDRYWSYPRVSFRSGGLSNTQGKDTHAQFKRRTSHVPHLIPIWVDPNNKVPHLIQTSNFTFVEPNSWSEQISYSDAFYFDSTWIIDKMFRI